MILIGLIGLCVGAILGWHFRVLMLVPTALLASAGVAAMELAGRHNLAHALLAGAILACVMQFGYLLALFVKPFGFDSETAGNLEA
jgi:hypothetical protein